MVFNLSSVLCTQQALERGVSRHTRRIHAYRG